MDINYRKSKKNKTSWIPKGRAVQNVAKNTITHINNYSKHKILQVCKNKLS